jgi:transcriptional regulator with XRE-family HTH domain
MEHPPGEDYPAQLKRLRAGLGLSQAALAKALGVSFPTINRWENGKFRPSQLSWNQLLKLADEGEADRVAEPEPPPYPEPPPVLDFTAKSDVVRALVEDERLSFGHLANPVFATEIASIDALPHSASRFMTTCSSRVGCGFCWLMTGPGSCPGTRTICFS